jgi:hypothetical protein
MVSCSTFERVVIEKGKAYQKRLNRTVQTNTWDFNRSEPDVLTGVVTRNSYLAK